MRNKPWMAIPLALVVTLGMAGCDNGEDDTPAVQSDNAQQVPATPPENDAISREGRNDDASSETADNTETPVPTAETEAQPPQVDEPAAPSDADDETSSPAASDSLSGSQDTPLGSGDDTSSYSLGNPDDDIEDSQAMPGAVSESDIEEFMEETERRFEEAQREIDKQFEEAEKSDPTQDLEAKTPEEDAGGDAAK